MITISTVVCDNIATYFDGRKEMSDPMGVLYKSFCNDCAEDEGFSKFILSQ